MNTVVLTVYYGWYFVRYATARSFPAPDDIQSDHMTWTDTSENGGSVIHFIKNSNDEDLNLDDVKYLLFARGPLLNGDISYHTLGRYFSADSFDFTCGK